MEDNGQKEPGRVTSGFWEKEVGRHERRLFQEVSKIDPAQLPPEIVTIINDRKNAVESLRKALKKDEERLNKKNALVNENL